MTASPSIGLPTSLTTMPRPLLRAVPANTDSWPSTPQYRPFAAPPAPTGLPEGATVVAMLPQDLLAHVNVQLDGVNQTLVGYLVMVPTAQAVSPPPPAAPPAPAVPLLPPVRTAAPNPHGLSVDAEQRTIHLDGVQLNLTYIEFELLAHLVEYPNLVHTREQLISTVWGYGHVGDSRTVDVHIARLRGKLGAPYRERIVTVRRVGYKYTPGS
jgi:DNA-binding response OmpR family regulator